MTYINPEIFDNCDLAVLKALVLKTVAKLNKQVSDLQCQLAGERAARDRDLLDLEQARTQLTEESARLDWLSEQHHKVDGEWLASYVVIGQHTETFREAIDRERTK